MAVSGQQVKLQPSDNAEPIDVPIEVANMSVTIKNMLEGKEIYALVIWRAHVLNRSRIHH